MTKAARLVSPQRAAVLAHIAERLAGNDPGHPLRVGIDGVCGVGKSTFARDLVAVLERGNRPVVLLDSDGFHHVRDRRYQRGRDSARGYYEDAYDFDALAERVLQPLGPGGNRVFAVKIHDLATDAIVTQAIAKAAQDSVLVFAATFIQRDGLRELWDEVVYLDADEEAALARGVKRDAAALGGEKAARAAYESRYLQACRIYLREQEPKAKATVVVEHSDPDAPVIKR
ncbi:MAG TPA: hypothetical protein VFT67_15340 [Jatrophihabitantaceae bacterium]|nr:hypothetical protein [Jatrophihabitantaceae bacterium]